MIGFICCSDRGINMKVLSRGKYKIVCPGNDLGMIHVSEKISETIDLLRAQGHKKIGLDLQESPVIDSSVIGTVVLMHQRLSNDGGELVVITKRNRAVEAMFQMQLGKIIRIVESIDQL